MKFVATGKFDLFCPTCEFKLTDVDATTMERARVRHEKEKHHLVTTTERLPRLPMLGDRVRVQEHLQDEFARVYGGQVTRKHVVVQVVEDSKAYGGPMLFLDAKDSEPRIMIRPNQVELTWHNETERRAGLIAYSAKAVA